MTRLLDVHLLGSFLLTWDGQPVTGLAPARLQHLVAYLLLPDGLNLRSGADPHATRISGLAQGTVVTVMGSPRCDGKMVWWPVQRSGAARTAGWVAKGAVCSPVNWSGSWRRLRWNSEFNTGSPVFAASVTLEGDKGAQQARFLPALVTQRLSSTNGRGSGRDDTSPSRCFGCGPHSAMHS